MTAHRIALLGDVGGHLPPVAAAFQALGGDLAAGTIPLGLTIIQAGDLVHKGPDSDTVVALVDHVLAMSAGRYLQLLGNHEASYLGGAAFGSWDVSTRTARTLSHWVRSDRARLAASVDCQEYGELLVTHAGLTRWLWLEMGRPPTAADAAEALNRLLHTDRHRAFSPGVLLEGGGFSRGQPGVVWAEATSELYTSWVGHRPPFGQVHGHSSAFDWERDQWSPGVLADVARRAVLDRTARHLTVLIGGRPFLGIDPGFGESVPKVALVPLVLTATV